MNNNNNTNERIAVLTSHFTHSTSMASEKQAALSAIPPDSDSPTIFDKIINKEIPSTVVYEDDKDLTCCANDLSFTIFHKPTDPTKDLLLDYIVLAFRDINPQAPVHILIIPKVRDGLTGISKAEERHFDILGRLLYTAKLVAKQEGLDEGYRVVINDGPQGCQSVYHIHLHVIGGRQLNWPPG